MFRFFQKSRQSSQSSAMAQRGFSLVELLVTVSIMGLILAIVVRNQKSYTETISLTNVADQMSITLRQAQTYGIAVKELTPGSANFSTPYGVSISLLGSGSPISYISFADKNGNGSYDNDWTCAVGAGSECLQKTQITEGNVIQSLCIIPESGAEDCNTPKRLDITYARPRTEARIVAYDAAGTVINTSLSKAVKVKFNSSGAQEKVLVVYKVGQISVVEPAT